MSIKTILGMTGVVGIIAGVTALSFGTTVPYSGVDTVRDASVFLVLYGDQGQPLGSCSGTLIDDLYKADGDQVTVLTAGHCASGISFAMIELPGELNNYRIPGNSYGFLPVKVDDQADVAVFQADNVTEKDLPEARIYGGTVSFGDVLYVSGFPLGLPQDLSWGLASMVMCIEDFAKAMGIESCDWLRNSVPISPGSSGSGVYKLTNRGFEIVGVISAGYQSRMETSSKFSLAVTLENLRSFLHRFSVDGPTKA